MRTTVRWKAVRLGSYSIRSHFSRNAVFVTFKVYNTVMVFMTAAFVTGWWYDHYCCAFNSRIFLFQLWCIRFTFVLTLCYHANHAATACRGRLHFNDCHLFIPYLQLQRRLQIQLLINSQAYISFLTSLRRPKVRPKRLVCL